MIHYRKSVKQVAIVMHALFIALGALTGCGRSKTHASNIEDFATLVRGPSGISGASFLDVKYCGSEENNDVFMLEHIGANDLVVFVKIGTLNLKGRMKFRDYRIGVPLAVVMDEVEYRSLLGLPPRGKETAN